MAKLLKYTGTRTKPFTAKCPSGTRYPVEPEVSRVIEVSDEDAQHLLNKQPALWQFAAAVADSPALPDEPAPKPSKDKKA